MSRSIHRRALLRALCLPLLLVTIVACHRQDPSALNANELFFDETLASISPDATLPDLFYIGTEDGVVYAYDADQGTTRRWLTAFDRIYKVLRDQPADSAAQPHDGTTFWVGTRNMGVVRCQLQGDSLVLRRQYALPRSGRGTHYSVYDLHQDPSGLYVATSNGLFLLSPNDTMQALHASWEIQSGEGAFRPLVVSDIRPLHNGNLVCASASGVLSIDTRRRQSHLLLRGNCTSLSLSGDTLLALCGDSIKALLPDGRLVGKSRLSHPAYTCFHEPSTRMNYLLDGTSVQFFSNDEIADRLTPRRAPLPRPVRTFCHNVIANDPARGQSLLVTEHALLRVGHHQDLFSDIGNVSYACHDGPFIYYLVGAHLFRQRIGEQTAIQVKDLSRGSSDVRFMTIADGTLYYADSGNRVFTAPIYSSYLLNSLLSWDHKVSPQLGQDLTAIGHDGSGVYVGIRDGLQQLGREKGQLQLQSASASTIADPFITAFSAPTSSGRLFLATLNDGLFVGRQGSFRHLAASRGLSFVRDIAVLPTASGADSLFVLTNHRLLCGTEKQLRVCDTLTAMRRLAVADASHAYGFPDYGLISLADHERYFSDIRFNPKACIAVEGRVYAGSSCGVYTFDTSLHKQNNLEQGYTTVQFERRVLFSRSNIACLVVLTIVAIMLLWFFFGLAVAKRRMLMRIAKLRTSIRSEENAGTGGDTTAHTLAAKTDQLQRYLQRLNKLEQQVTDLGLMDKIRQRDILDRLNSSIQDLTIDLPSILIGCLNRQVALMRRHQWEGYEAYVAATERLMQGKDEAQEGMEETTALSFCEQTASTIGANAQWMSEAERIDKRYDQYLLVADLEGAGREIFLAMRDLCLNEEGKAVPIKKDNPMSREKKVEEADRILQDINREGIARHCHDLLLGELAHARDRYHAALSEEDPEPPYPQRLLREAVARAEAFVGELAEVGDGPFQDALPMLIRVSKAYQRLKIATTLLQTKEIIEDFEANAKARDKEKVRKQFATCVSSFYDAVGQCEDKSILQVIGLARKKGGKEKSRFLNEDLLVLLLAGRRAERDEGGSCVLRPILSDDNSEKLLNADMQSLRRARRAFRNLATTKLSEQSKRTEVRHDEDAPAPSPLARLKAFGHAHPDSFASWLAEIVEGI